MQNKTPWKYIINAADLSKNIFSPTCQRNTAGLKRITQHVRNLQGLSQIFSEPRLISGNAASVNDC